MYKKSLFNFFTGTKAHWKERDPEGSTRVLSCREILLLKSLAWERPSSFDPSARLSKVQSRNLELITLLLYFFGQLCYVSLVGFGSLYLGGVWDYSPDAYPGNTSCMEVPIGTPGACLSPCPENPLFQWAFSGAVCGSHGQPETPQFNTAAQNSSLSSVKGHYLCFYFFQELRKLSIPPAF